MQLNSKLAESIEHVGLHLGVTFENTNLAGSTRISGVLGRANRRDSGHLARNIRGPAGHDYTDKFKLRPAADPGPRVTGTVPPGPVRGRHGRRVLVVIVHRDAGPRDSDQSLPVTRSSRGG